MADLTKDYVFVVFNGPPGAVPWECVDVEDASGVSVDLGEWQERRSGDWALLIPVPEGTIPGG